MTEFNIVSTFPNKNPYTNFNDEGPEAEGVYRSHFPAQIFSNDLISQPLLEPEWIPWCPHVPMLCQSRLASLMGRYQYFWYLARLNTEGICWWNVKFYSVTKLIVQKNVCFQKLSGQKACQIFDYNIEWECGIFVHVLIDLARSSCEKCNYWSKFWYLPIQRTLASP
jgi:hypothetical protein